MGPAGGVFFRLTSSFRTRAALGLRPVTAPVTVFLPLGIVLGPWGANFISLTALGHLDVVISIVLATLGVFIGIAAGTQRGAVGRLLTASTVEAAVTILAVAGAVYALMHAWDMPSPIPYVLVALVLGLCASASAAPSVDEGDNRARRVAARVADLDDVLPIVVGGVVLAMIGEAGTPALAALALSIGLGVAIAFSGWLLFERTAGAERDVFVLGTLALLGGSAAYLEMSPLLAGLAGGWLWARAPGQTEQVVATHLRKVQHPLVVLLLITAGASLQATTAGIWLFAPYLVFRTAGKLAGGWMASRLASEVAPSDLGAYLIPPGVIGIAFALNVLQVAPEAGGPIVFAVSAGAIVSELLAVIVTPGPNPV
ncbi:MAG TPA: hypothetical protein VJ813_18915 [Vicinamibacterales bacterium]|nr:hypothetical protein [Vicinamibacterales bacterium]